MITKKWGGFNGTLPVNRVSANNDFGNVCHCSWLLKDKFLFNPCYVKLTKSQKV